MTLDPNHSNQRIFLIEVMGGNCPTQRQSCSWLKVSQKHLSQAIQRIHRSGGKVLQVTPVGDRQVAEAQFDQSPVLKSFCVSTDDDLETETETKTKTEPEIVPRTEEQRSPQPVQTEWKWERPKSSMTYPSFPLGKINPSNLSPVRRKSRKTRGKLTRRFWVPSRGLSKGEERRKFFRSQSSRSYKR